MYYKDSKGRVFVVVSQQESVGRIPAITTLFSCAESVKIILLSDDFTKHCERGLFVKFTPEVQNHAGV